MNALAHFIQKIQLTVGFLCMSIFLCAIVIQVFCRYVGITVVWTGEISTYAFIWAVFMGAGVTTYENKHFSFDFLVSRLRETKKHYVRFLIALILFLFSVLVFYFGIVISKKFWNYTWISIPAIKMGYTWLCLPLFGASASIYSFKNMLEHMHYILLEKKKAGDIK